MENIVKGTTESGFEFEVRREALNNMELVDALAEIEGNPLAMSRVCVLLLGKEQRKKLYDHLRTSDGRVPLEQVEAELMAVMAACGNTGKNS